MESIDDFPGFEQQQCRNRIDSITLGSSRMVFDVHFANANTAIIFDRQFIDQGSDLPGRSTPSRPESPPKRAVPIEEHLYQTLVL